MKQEKIEEILEGSSSRFEFWIHFLNKTKIKQMVEVGVYRGEFAETVLTRCDSIRRYYMIDPWRQLDNWNKPANKEDEIFERFLSETMSRTEFASDKRVVLRGKTTEVVNQIPDGELDFAYIDGDHTLKGITIDLIRIFPKIREGGWIGGDDFVNNMWQHATSFEPTLVYPFAVYFAESVDARIYALPYGQFLLEKNSNHPFSFIDLTGSYGDTGLRDQFRPDRIMKMKLNDEIPFIMKVSRAIKRLVKKLK